ncbi:hypothetical protein [Streptomyces collinus]|uniref:hypothetical protein n=1 Tax=Streptomyces collinus TaxID=42684 RepID=UPI002941E0CF|nr:hypothetical protein [Streptomyces collinus]
MELVRIFSDVKRRPSAYGLNGGYREFVAFLNGANAASGGKLLRGFSDFLAGKIGSGQNLYWALLVAQIAAAPEPIASPDEILGAQEQVAIDCLFRELLEFLNEG